MTPATMAAPGPERNWTLTAEQPAAAGRPDKVCAGHKRPHERTNGKRGDDQGACAENHH